jgi:class 3 adenylate cyclase/pimeloyl-ACP methyl ester carboxylesterase
MEREVRYCTTEDGVRIAYCVEGEGPPVLFQPIFMESFGLDHMLPAYRKFLAAMGEGRSIVRFDARGTGMSQRGIDTQNYQHLALDIRGVLKAAGFQRVSIWASTTTGPTTIQFALDNPAMVSRLVFYGAYADLAAVFPESTMRSFAHLAESNWELAAQLFADMTGRREFPDDTVRLADWYKQSCTGPETARLILTNIGVNLTESLGRVTQPALVVHRVNDPTIPIEAGRLLASHLPNARFVQLPGNVHAPYLGDCQSVIEAVRVFLDEDPESRAVAPQPAKEPAASSTFRTILFTDLVGHTEMMSRLGDERGRAVLREHEDITRNVLRQHGGTEVKTMGDGFMASFGSVTKAVECAIVLQRAFAEREGEALAVRVGLNAGEPIEEDGDLFGATVILASRIAAKAGAGEILVADTVRGLCSGKGFPFADRGDFVAKGFEEPVRVFEVSWRE